jgi:hypothetical protein
MTEIPEPYWDKQIQSLVVKESDEWIVSVTPMLCNDRIVFTRRSSYPGCYDAGWCYDKGGAAVLAAMVWDPDTQHEPVGYKKAAVPR